MLTRGSQRLLTFGLPDWGSLGSESVDDWLLIGILGAYSLLRLIIGGAGLSDLGPVFPYPGGEAFEGGQHAGTHFG